MTDPSFNELEQQYSTVFFDPVLRHEAKASLDENLKDRWPKAPVQSMAGLVAFNESNALAELKYGQNLLEHSSALGDLSAPAYRQQLATNTRLAVTDGMESVLRSYAGLDALVVPTLQGFQPPTNRTAASVWPSSARSSRATTAPSPSTPNPAAGAPSHAGCPTAPPKTPNARRHHPPCNPSRRNARTLQSLAGAILPR